MFRFLGQCLQGWNALDYSAGDGKRRDTLGLQCKIHVQCGIILLTRENVNYGEEQERFVRLPWTNQIKGERVSTRPTPAMLLTERQIQMLNTCQVDHSFVRVLVRISVVNVVVFAVVEVLLGVVVVV